MFSLGRQDPECWCTNGGKWVIFNLIKSGTLHDPLFTSTSLIFISRKGCNFLL